MSPASDFRARLVAREPLYGAWSMLSAAVSVRLLAASGLDYVVIDLQHGTATEHDLPGLTDAIRVAGAVPVARVRHPHPADIGRALDLGCAGVIVPNVDSAAQAKEVAGACRYPPAGYRSGGGVLATPDPFCIVMAESAEAVADLEATLAVDGVDGLYVGPRDLSYSLGTEPDPDDPVLRPVLERIWAACAAAGKPVGVHSTEGATARRYREAGCTLLTVTVDIAGISRSAEAEARTARSLPVARSVRAGIQGQRVQAGRDDPGRALDVGGHCLVHLGRGAAAVQVLAQPAELDLPQAEQRSRRDLRLRVIRAQPGAGGQDLRGHRDQLVGHVPLVGAQRSGAAQHVAEPHDRPPGLDRIFLTGQPGGQAA